MKQQLEARKSLPRSLKKGDQRAFSEWGELEGCFLMVQWDGEPLRAGGS